MREYSIKYKKLKNLSVNKKEGNEITQLNFKGPRRKKEMKRNKRNVKGITLIALVVTIVVLLILAGVSISMLSGENGIITQAQEAKNNTEAAKLKEELNLKIAEEAINRYTIGDETLPPVFDSLNVVGINKIIADENSITFHLVLLENGKYYNAECKGTEQSNSFENISTASGLREEAKLLFKLLNSDVDDLEFTSNNSFKYNGINYQIIENMTPNYFEMYVEKSEDIKMIVNSGADGIVVLPIHNYESANINWGDGTETVAKKNKIISKEIASLDNVQVAVWQALGGHWHQYTEKNKEFEVTISGNITEINSDECIYYCVDDKDNISYPNGRAKIIEITQWGTTGLEKIDLSFCYNLRKIAEPKVSSFVNIISFNGAFLECTNLAGTVPKLWLMGTNSEENSYKGIPHGQACFYGCTNVENYDEIPNYWKTLPEGN